MAGCDYEDCGKCGATKVVYSANIDWPDGVSVLCADCTKTLSAPETIIACAIQIDGVTVVIPNTGTEKMWRDTIFSRVRMARLVTGYLTSLARFVTPDEARAIAERAGQSLEELT